MVNCSSLWVSGLVESSNLMERKRSSNLKWMTPSGEQRWRVHPRWRHLLSGGFLQWSVNDVPCHWPTLNWVIAEEIEGRLHRVSPPTHREVLMNNYSLLVIVTSLCATIQRTAEQRRHRPWKWRSPLSTLTAVEVCRSSENFRTNSQSLHPDTIIKPFNIVAHRWQNSQEEFPFVPLLNP